MGFTKYSFKYKAYLIDDEHEHLFGALAELRSLAGMELEAAAVPRALDNFTALLCRHFDSEETLLAKLDQSEREYDWHCLAHTSLLEKIVGMCAGIRAGDPCAPAQLADELTDWLIEHNIVYDRRMRELLEATAQEASPIVEIACRPTIAMNH